MTDRAAPSNWMLALLACAQLIIALDATIVFVALPEISRALDFSAQRLQWVVSAYTVAFGGFLLLGGRATDLLGRRRMYGPRAKPVRPRLPRGRPGPERVAVDPCPRRAGPGVARCCSRRPWR
ncbi:major facilitator superfamily (MFS) transporter [Pseudomonas aeruginosa]|nr:major facilitator superfamily (MFS) transporter [Pseudomonas aeruginosa]